MQRFLDLVKRGGNKLPDPIVLFASLCAIITLASWVTALAGPARSWGCAPTSTRWGCRRTARISS